jgi:predicted O-methyltransferase YrrM
MIATHSPSDCTFTADWFSVHAESWHRHLRRRAGRPNLAFLEVGCFEGRATIWLLENVLTHPTARIDCIDTFEGSFEHSMMGIDIGGIEARFDHNIAAGGGELKVTKIKGRSGDCLRRLEPRSYDFAYIDGSHLARDVLEDAVLAFGLLKGGGLMIFDDYGWDRLCDDPRHPKIAIDAFLRVYEDEFLVLAWDYQVVVEKA